MKVREGCNFVYQAHLGFPCPGLCCGLYFLSHFSFLSETFLGSEALPLMVLVSSNLGCLTRALLLLPLFWIKRIFMGASGNIVDTNKQINPRDI